MEDKFMKKITSLLLCLALTLALLTGCAPATNDGEDAANDPVSTVSQTEGENASQQESPEELPADEEDGENYETGDASLDNTRNTDGIGERELLVVSFGTSYNDSRRLTIGAIEEAMETAFPEWSVRRGFTSQIIIDHVLRRDQVSIDNVTQALDRAVENGVKTLVIQPTHLMDGLEYNDVVDEVATYADAFDHVAVGAPLLTSEDDFRRVALALADCTAEYDDGETAIVFMGHGTEAASNQVYAKMQEELTDMGLEHYYVGTVEATPSVEDVLALVQQGSYQRVVLRPLMIVAGDHANNDMAGEDEDSWNAIFKAAGYDVVCVVEGLGQLPEIQQLFVEHAQAAMDSLN
jgi:sirohydrochlorin cobaltochelatase